MKKTLQDQYLLIKEGKGHIGVFLTEAKRQFPNIVRNAATFEEAAASLITKNIITENIVSLEPINSPFDLKKKEPYELAFENFLAEAKKKENEDEKVKAEEKKVSKRVEEDYSHNFDNSDEKNPDNMIFDQIMMGYYAEMKDPKNADKTMQELKDMVFKNLTKDPIHYTKDGQFGIKGLGYTTEAPGLGEPKEAKGKYKASGYGDLNEGMFSSKPLGDVEGAKEMALKVFKAWIKKNSGLSDPEALTDEQVIEKIKDFAKKNPSNIVHQLWKQEKHLFEGESIEESKLRKVIREMVEGEIEEMRHLGSMFQSKLGDDKKERAEGEPKHKSVPLHPKFIKKLLQNKDIKFITNNEGTKLLIKKNTTLNPPVTTDSREDISTPPEIINFLNNGENQEPIVGNAIFPGLNNEPFEYVGLKNVVVGGTPGNRTIRITILNPNVKEIKKEDTMESLKESIEKELMAINKEAEHEIIASKLEKVQALIDKKQSQISRLDEDEDMKDLTDAKKVKEITKDIKSLEKAKDKLEKIMHKGKAKPLSKAVIDEDEIIDETPIEDDNTQESLRESVEKELVAINKEAEHEIITSKLEKVQALIDKKQSQISRLDEDEDMKDLTDAKKVKEISKDIKSLERAKAKLEKMANKKGTTKKAEVIDETNETIDEAELFEIDDETAEKIIEKAEQYYDEYGTLEDALSEFKDEDEKELANQHLKSAYGIY